MNGYAGKILRVNLSKGEVSTEPLPEKLARDYIWSLLRPPWPGLWYPEPAR
jgi:aldehyde:ferredoxin oxidoreductase